MSELGVNITHLLFNNICFCCISQSATWKKGEDISTWMDSVYEPRGCNFLLLTFGNGPSLKHSITKRQYHNYTSAKNEANLKGEDVICCTSQMVGDLLESTYSPEGSTWRVQLKVIKSQLWLLWKPYAYWKLNASYPGPSLDFRNFFAYPRWSSVTSLFHGTMCWAWNLHCGLGSGAMRLWVRSSWRRDDRLKGLENDTLKICSCSRGFVAHLKKIHGLFYSHL